MTTAVQVAAGLTARQLELLRRMAQLTPAPWVMGGYAEDALLAGTVTRPHVDVDWLFPRRELELRLAQARAPGFKQFETLGEAAPGEPFYLFAQDGDLSIDMGITDEANGRHVIRVRRLAFDIAGREAPAGYQVVLPDDTYDYPPVEIDGIPIRVASPLALYQLRVGIASQGSFSELSDRHREQSGRLSEAFLGDRSDAELAPRIERSGGGP